MLTFVTMRIPSVMARFFKSSLFLVLCAATCFIASLFISENKSSSHDATVIQFENTLNKKKEQVRIDLTVLAEKAAKWNYKQLFSEKPGYYERLLSQNGVVFLIFENDTLSFWSDNTVAVDNLLSHNNFNNKIVKLPNGWFEVIRLATRKKELYGLILLKREYIYQNKYLNNKFQHDFNLDASVRIKVDAEKKNQHKVVAAKTSSDVYSEDGNYLCSLDFSSTTTGSTWAFYLTILLNTIGLIFSLWLLHTECTVLAKKIGKGWGMLLLILSVIVLRYLTMLIGFPQEFYQTKLFSPELYGDATYLFLGSLGDLLINVMLVFYLSYYFHENISMDNFKDLFTKSSGQGWSLRSKWYVVFLLLLLVFFVSRIINYIFSGIISNSNIPFTLNDIFNQNIYTYLSLIIISLLLLSYFLLLNKTVELILVFGLNKKEQVLISVIVIAAFITLSQLMGTVDMIMVFWPILLYILLLWIKQNHLLNSFSLIVILLFIVSFFSARVILKYTNYKERDNRIVLAQKLSAEQDPLAEHLFADAENRITTDTSLIHLLSHTYHRDKSPVIIPKTKRELFTKRLLAKYFSGYWDKYEIRISVFDTTCLPLVQGSLPDRDNLNYFEETISSQGIPTESKHLVYLANSSGRISYLAHIPLLQSGSDTSLAFRIADLFIEFDSRVVSDEIGFPDLMLDRKIGIVQELMDYSYAKYKDNKLISYHGKFPYSLSADFFSDSVSAGSDFPHSFFLDASGYNHLVYNAAKDSTVVISKKDNGTIAIITTFSYLFAFFSMVLLLLLLLRILLFDRNIQLNSFRSRIQFALVSMVLFSLLFFGAGTIYYINQQYGKQTIQNVRDKMVSALIDATHELGTESELKDTKSDFFSYILKKMSTIFMTDISLYDTKGNLVGSSQMRMFNEGLMSHKMCPESYANLAVKHHIEFIHDEKIGNLKYLSAYCAFRNNNGTLLGYLNIPYFARQSELEKEVSNIIAAIINIYVLLFVISMVLTLLVTEYFTKPLRLIQEKLSRIKLGMAGEPIEWKSHDEIGHLVNEYNRMIEELQRSAELLAKSERETAWREMARQVAHEIKNPLTPMKLSIQHLQRIWNNKDEDMDEKFKRISVTIIEQIDALSNIASEFSNFAKMPTGFNEKIHLKNVLENSISLFNESIDTKIIFECRPEEAFVFADKEQILRVCNNLFKNALQAIPENRPGKIEVTLKKENDSFVIKIKDNGVGISEDKMNKIFTPNFTTKTGGMGLGLAMVKNIIEAFGGKIWFDTLRGTGTTFYISIPAYKD